MRKEDVNVMVVPEINVRDTAAKANVYHINNKINKKSKKKIY